MSMAPERKSLLYTIGFYVCYVILSAIATKADPGGPCTPGLGAFMLLGIIFVAIVGFCTAGIMYWLGSKNLTLSIRFHLLVIGLYLLGAFLASIS